MEKTKKTIEKNKKSLAESGDIGDIAEEFHKGGGLEGYAHELTTEEEGSDSLRDLD